MKERLQSALGSAYRLEKELGGGGMSRVFVGEEVRLGRQVVIKVLPPEMAAGVSVDRFEREIQLAAKLQHPHIVPLLTAGASGDLLYYIMPFIEGESLRARLAHEHELPVGEAVRILRDVTDALAYAHAHGIVHRDIKPDNVLLSGKHALVTDFGVAKAVAESTGKASLTSMGVALGTPAYMAPEQATADPNTDHRADIYAVGALAYEMLAGRLPFTGPTAQAVLAAHVSDAPEPVTKYRESVPPALAGVVMRCLAKKPADRFQTADEVHAQLEVIATPSGGMTPTGAQPVISSGTEAAIRRAHPVRVAGLYALAAVGALALVYLLMTQLGLPGWVFAGAVALLAVGLPIMVVTGVIERRRALARSTGRVAAAPEGIQHWLTWRRALLGGGAAFGALGLGTAVYMAMRLLGIGPVGTLVASGVLADRERIVVAEFDNAAADTSLGETVSQLFAIDLAQSPAVTVLEPAQIAAVLARMQRDPESPLRAALALEVAQREGLKALLTGEVRQVGQGFVLSSRLVAAATGEALWAGRETAASAEAVVTAVDRLSASLRERIGESLRTIRGEAPLEQVTTGSTEALRTYAQGVRANDLGEFERATSLLRQAVAQDTGFAMAYRKLGIVLSNRGRDSTEWAPLFRKAFERRDRLTDRERYLAEAAYYQLVQGDDQSAIAAYRSLLEKYATDRVGLNNLALLAGRRGNLEEAKDLFVRSVALGHAPPVTYASAIGAQYAFGAADSATRTLELFAAEYPGHPNLLALQARFASARLAFDSAQRILTALRAAQRGNPEWEVQALRGLSDVARVRGRLAVARRHGDEALDLLYAQPLGFTSRTPRGWLDAQRSAEEALWFRDDRRAALQTMDAALQRHLLARLRAEERPYLQLAQLYARAGRPDRAREFLGKFDAEVDERTRRDAESGRHRALAQIALAAGRADEAVAEAQRAAEKQLVCPFCRLFPLAETYDRAGRADSAVALYERYLATPWLYRSGSDAENLWVVYRRLGELYEAHGDRAKALDYYGRFVELWKDADPEFQPLVREVTSRVARLARERD